MLPKTPRLQLGQHPQALVQNWRKNWTFKINIPSLNASISTNKVFVFNLTTDDHSKHSGLIRPKFLLLAPVKSVAYFLGHPPGNSMLSIINHVRLKLTI